MSERLFAHDRRDVRLVVATALHALLVVALLLAAAQTRGAAAVLPRLAAAVVLAVALNWTSNTVSHIHLHTPLFASARANGAFSLFLGALLGIPQSWWKRRHLQHHGIAEAPEHGSASGVIPAGIELLVIGAAWTSVLFVAPGLFVSVLCPAFLLGLGLCAIQGHEEHARAADGVDLRAPLYNLLWFNDGFHAAHHRSPSTHWCSLPSLASDADVRSKLPPILRWAERLPEALNAGSARLLDVLEKTCLAWPAVLSRVRARHARAWRLVLRDLAPENVRAVRIVGGGIFPRSALILAELFPAAHLEIREMESEHIRLAEGLLARAGLAVDEGRVSFVAGAFEVGHEQSDVDLLVIPLAFRGDRRRLYEAPDAPLVVVHDWIWRRPRDAKSAVVAWWLLKRLNLIERPERR